MKYIMFFFQHGFVQTAMWNITFFSKLFIMYTINIISQQIKSVNKSYYLLTIIFLLKQGIALMHSYAIQRCGM